MFFSKSTIFAAFSSKNFVFCVWFLCNFRSNFPQKIFPAGHFLKKPDMGNIHVQHMTQKEEWTRGLGWRFWSYFLPEILLFSKNFISFLSTVHKKIILASSFRISRQKTAFFAAKTDFHFIFSEIKNSYAENNCCFRSQNRSPKLNFTVFSEIKNSDPEKMLFSRTFMSFYRSQKSNFGQQSPYFSPKNCFFCSQNRLSF